MKLINEIMLTEAQSLRIKLGTLSVQMKRSASKVNEGVIHDYGNINSSP